jgi:hypothetical protein
MMVFHSSMKWHEISGVLQSFFLLFIGRKLLPSSSSSSSSSFFPIQCGKRGKGSYKGGYSRDLAA